jgi:nitroreductase / dihydropteridine reductase
MDKIIQALNWRYATKVFDPNKKLSKEQVDSILEIARLSPSSYGLQAWGFVRVVDPEIRKKLKEVAWGQPQITDASDLIVLAAKTVVDETTVEDYMKSIADIRQVSPESLSGFSQMINGGMSNLSQEQRHEWVSKQVYIALGMMLEACALEGIDACPMEGIEPKKFDEILGLESKGLSSKVVIALGYRDESDASAKYPKVRYSKEQVIFEI